MANSNGWGDGASNNDIGWGQGADNAIGWGSIYANSWAGATDIVGTPAVDPDAQAFITAASITDPTQQSAINQLVVDLKGYNIWSKFSALYPMVGGTSTTHKFNLKNPLDTNAAFRLSFLGGWTHSSTGAKPNGTNAYADTFYVPNTHLTDINSNHISFYSRTNAQFGIEMGGGPVPLVDLALNYNGAGGSTCWNMASFVNHFNLDSRCFMINSRTASNSFKVIKNGSVLVSSTGTAGTTKPNVSYYIGKRNYPDSIFSTLECAFASIGDGLTDAEAANFYTAVQAFQVTLGRSIGTQTVSDADAQAFVTNAGIVDQVEANAVNNLVIGLKADGLWSKMSAIYPMVGGSSTSHSYNLRNTSQFQITWNGGVTHSGNGVQFNGTNSYGITGYNPSVNGSLNSHHFSFYSRTQSNGAEVEFGVTSSYSAINLLEIRTSGTTYVAVNSDGTYTTFSDTDSRAFYLANRTASNVVNAWRNSTKKATGTTASTSLPNGNHWLGAWNNIVNPALLYYSTKQCAFASIGDGLTDTEATNFYNRVQTFNTALARQV